MKTMAATAAPPARGAAPPSDAPGPDAGSEGSFAAALGQARDPIKAAVDRAAKSPPRTEPSAQPKPPAKPTSGAAREALSDGDSERSEATAAEDVTDTTSPVPGTPSITEAVIPDPASAVAAMLGNDAATVEADSALSLDAGAPLANANTPGRPRLVKATLPALAPADAATGKSDAAAALAATAASAPAGTSIAPTAVSHKSAVDAHAMTAPTLSAPPAPVAHSAPAAPAAANAAAAMPFAAHLAAAVDSPAFAPALATQVSWLAKEGLQHARLTLNPADLGPVGVRIVLEGTQARIDFSAAIASTRAAIEAGLPTLAAALHDNGMTLAGGGVSDGQSRPGTQGDRAHSAQGLADISAQAQAQDAQVAAVAMRPARGLVDLIA